MSMSRMRWLWLFPIVGIVLLIVAMVLWQVRRQFEALASRANGEVVELVHSHDTDSDGRSSDTWCPDVRFTTAAGDAVRFTGSVCSSPPSYRVGERVTVLYLPDDPQGASLSGFAERWLGSLITGGIGLVFTLLGALFTVPPLLSRRRSAELKVSGRPVMAQVTDVGRNTNLRINGRSPWRVHAQWLDPASRTMHLFESDDLWFDPTQYLGAEIRVLVDPQRPGRYWMDTSGLPEVG